MSGPTAGVRQVSRRGAPEVTTYRVRPSIGPLIRALAPVPSGAISLNDQALTSNAKEPHPPVIASNQATPRIVALYKSLGFVLYLVKGPRMISCNGDRRSAREILALKNM